MLKHTQDCDSVTYQAFSSKVGKPTVHPIPTFTHTQAITEWCVVTSWSAMFCISSSETLKIIRHVSGEQGRLGDEATFLDWQTHTPCETSPARSHDDAPCPTHTHTPKPTHITHTSRLTCCVSGKSSITAQQGVGTDDSSSASRPSTSTKCQLPPTPSLPNI